MKIDGKAIAEGILENLCPNVSDLKRKGVTPTLAVIQVGDDPGSTAYIRQKQKAAEAIGAKVILSHQPACRQGRSSAISNQQLQKIIEEFNNTPSIHGIIVQRPLPKPLRADGILISKDVDGFLPNSPFPVPVAEAVMKILKKIHSLERSHPAKDRVRPFQRFDDWLPKKQVVVIGRGETAGKPIAEALKKHGIDPIVVHSQTPNPDEIIRTSDIVVSCVGKPNVVRRDTVKRGVVLISVGIWRDSAGKLHGDYEEDEIREVAGFYTPTPGGVGPVNVACLMANLYRSCLSSR